jgi:hypothetical protein
VTDRNIELTKHALREYSRVSETSETIWNGIHSSPIRIRIHQFLYKAMHSTQKIGDFWEHIPDYEERRLCQTCRTMETMEHILIHCREPAVRTIWQSARRLWPHENTPWPQISIGLLLGCGSITIPGQPEHDDENDQRHPNQKGVVRLLQILLSEAAHLIWVIRCERVIQEKRHNENEIRARWVMMINKRITEDRIIATIVKKDNTHLQRLRGTWGGILGREGEPPEQWTHNFKVLVGTRGERF